MSDTFDNALKQLGKWGEVVAGKSGFYFKKAVDKGGELTKIGKVQLEIEKLKRELNHKYTDLGRIVFQSAEKTDPLNLTNNEEYNSAVEDIRLINKTIGDKHEEKLEIKRENIEKEPVEDENNVPIGI